MTTKITKAHLLGLEAAMTVVRNHSEDWRVSAGKSTVVTILDDLIAQAKAAPDDEAVGEVVAFSPNCHEVSWLKGRMPALGSQLFTNPQPERFDYSDAYQGAREDLLTWKRRALAHEQTIRELNQVIDNLGDALNAENGPTFIGEPLISETVQVSRDAVHKLFRAAGLSGSVPFDQILIAASEKLAERGGVPEGYAIVPLDPVKCLDMGFAYVDAAREAQPKKKWAFSIPGYKAMLAAAQEGK